MKFSIVVIIFLFTLGACSSSKTPKDAKLVPLNSKSTSKTSTYSVANFTIQLADGWEEETASNNMRVTQFKLKKHPEYQVVVSYFGAMDNQLEENISRWKNQFSTLDEFSELELTTKNVTAIKLMGTFKQKPFPMAQDFVETPNYGTLAAIITSNEGPYFLKLTASKVIVEEQEKTFIEVLNSYQKMK